MMNGTKAVYRMMTRLRVLLISAFALLLVLACSNDGVGETAPTDGMALQGPRPVVEGLGGDPREPLVTDTIDLRKIGYTRGAEDAPVVVYEFSDFGCPYCSIFAKQSYPELHAEFVETGLVRWTYVPFVMGMFPNGAEAARTAECAAEQDNFWEMHDLLYENPNEWKGSSDSEAVFRSYSEKLGLDTNQFATCFAEDRQGARTEINNRAAAALRVRATPSFFINGRLVEGALPLGQFRRVLEMMAGS